MARQEFELTTDEFAELIEAAQPVPYMVFGGMAPRSPQENANDAWCALGVKRGFDGMTVEPLPHKGDRFFSAEVSFAALKGAQAQTK